MICVIHSLVGGGPDPRFQLTVSSSLSCCAAERRDCSLAFILPSLEFLAATGTGAQKTRVVFVARAAERRGMCALPTARHRHLSPPDPMQWVDGGAARRAVWPSEVRMRDLHAGPSGTPVCAIPQPSRPLPRVPAFWSVCLLIRLSVRPPVQPGSCRAAPWPLRRPRWVSSSNTLMTEPGTDFLKLPGDSNVQPG